MSIKRNYALENEDDSSFPKIYASIAKNEPKVLKLNETELMDEDVENKMEENPEIVNVLAQFCSESGVAAGPPIELPLTLSKEKLKLILDAFLKPEEKTPYTFFVENEEIINTLKSAVDKITYHEEKILKILYQPQAVFKVQAVTRCSASLSGHAEAVLHASFSPDGQHLATGSGDMTVRFWDVFTQTPHFTCRGHKHWVLVTAWSPDGERLASACKLGQIMLWDPITGNQLGRVLRGHKKWVTALSWEPLHLTADGVCDRLASAGKDGDVRIWNTRAAMCEKILSGHLTCVTALRWSGQGFIFSGSQDRTIKMWRAEDGVLYRTLEGHAHWVNTLALSTDYVLRIGAVDPRTLVEGKNPKLSPAERKTKAASMYNEVLSLGGGEERLVSGSDDFTLFMWNPNKEAKSVARLTGHQQLVNDVKFSPNMRLLASASFDKSIRLWNGFDGKFLWTLRGHVQGVYQIAWSADSRLLLSGSKDSTLKVWNTETKKILVDLPGHADEVYAVDWSPDGCRAVSGGKDKLLRIWQR